MPGINKNFPKRKAGDLVSAKEHNDLVSQVRMLSQMPVGSGVLINSVGVFPKGERKGVVIRQFRVTVTTGFYRNMTTNPVDCTRVTYDSTNDEWDDTATEEPVNASLFDSYGFEGDLLTCIKQNGKWFAIAGGRSWVQATLTEAMATGETSAADVQVEASGAQEIDVSDTLSAVDITLSADTSIYASWDSHTQSWKLTGFACVAS